MSDIPVALHSVPPPIVLHIMSFSPFYPVVTYKNVALKYQRMSQCHIPVPIYWFIFSTMACGPRYQTRSSAPLHKDHTIPSHNVASVWLCITLLTSKTPLFKGDLSLLIRVSTEGANFWHLTHCLWGYNGAWNFMLRLWC